MLAIILVYNTHIDYTLYFSFLATACVCSVCVCELCGEVNTQTEMDLRTIYGMCMAIVCVCAV